MHQWIGGVLFLCGFNSVLLSWWFLLLFPFLLPFLPSLPSPSPFPPLLFVALSPKKFTLGDIDILTSCQHKGTSLNMITWLSHDCRIGWLVKEGKIRRRRFFVLTETNQIQYFRTEDTRQPVAGSIPLNCLCAVDLYDDDEVKETG